MGPYDPYETYEQQEQIDPTAAQPQPVEEETPNPVLSVSRVTNLTATLAALSGILAAFFFHADNKKSYAIHRYSVQSIGMMVMYLIIVVACFAVTLLLQWIPVLGPFVRVVLTIVQWAASAILLVGKQQLMLHAYRGENYVLPYIGKIIMKYEKM